MSCRESELLGGECKGALWKQAAVLETKEPSFAAFDRDPDDSFQLLKCMRVTHIARLLRVTLTAMACANFTHVLEVLTRRTVLSVAVRSALAVVRAAVDSKPLHFVRWLLNI